MRLSALLPTMAWGTQISYPKWQQDRESVAATWDDTLFPNDEAKGLTLPFYFPIRPMAAVERGEGRYERYDQKIQKMDRSVKRQSDTWTRSLLNRDWRVRVAAADRGRSPLVVTGSYGAGRVAVLAGPAGSFDTFAGASPFWTALLGWLTEKRNVSQQSATATKPEMSISVSGSTAQVKLENQGAEPVAGTLIARVLTWEGALIGDVLPSTPGPIALPPSGTANVGFTLPRSSPKSYQALDYRYALQLRIGFYLKTVRR